MKHSSGSIQGFSLKRCLAIRYKPFLKGFSSKMAHLLYEVKHPEFFDFQARGVLQAIVRWDTTCVAVIR